MRKYLRYANLIILAAGTAGMLLMHWFFAGGTDERGLYPSNHPAWVLVGILTAAVLIAMWLLTRKAGTNRSYRQNFPPSIIAALGCVAAGIGLLSGSIRALGAGKLLGLAACLTGALGSISMFWAAVCRFRGKRSKLPVHCLPCFFFALQLFLLGQEFGSEPEMYRYLYRFWAMAAMVPACYGLWSFDVSLGKRPGCLFWCLVAAYCNLVAMAGSDLWLLHICMAIWMLTALPRLRHLPKQSRPVPQAAAESAPEPTQQTPAAEDAPSTTDALQPAADPLTVDLPDPEAILEELLRDYGQQENP